MTRHAKHSDPDPKWRPCRGRKHILAEHQFQIGQARAARAVYLSPDVQRIELEVVTEDGEHMILAFPSRLAGEVILDMTAAYEAIHPTLRTGSGASSWKGMS